MSAPLACLVEPRSEQTVQGLHPGRQIGVADLDDEVKVRSQHAVGVADPAIALEGSFHQAEVESPDLVIGKDRKPGHSAGGDVIDPVRFLNA